MTTASNDAVTHRATGADTGVARTLVVVTAGLSQPSSTRLLADRLTDATRRQVTGTSDLTVRVIELRALATDIAQSMVTGFPGPALRDALDAVTSADALIAVTPVFTGSYSGLFKSFFDVIDKDALAGTPVLIGATGGTARHSLVLEHAMRPLFSYLRTVVVPTAVYAASEDWGTGGGDHDLAARIDRAAAELAALMQARSPARVTEEAVVPFAQQLAALAVDG
ncbi:FMN reductase [Actinacidiphila acididurans]|uniref:FMN reductase n=1 Tax=Actinacidiphila acididurans TaxID=2784346 RepID=A0ABS2TP47_9ACTN|nr:FMN reductase [Actinacidiphila acididurans]MBM9505099.1 FMN reductase [Actinacidiphila acididurans]